MNLEDQIRACQKCPLYMHMPFSPIPGWGDKRAKIMLIGEAPGKDESIVEEPFVGRCGKFMDINLLKPAGLIRSELYITNMVKCMCRNGNKNRKPKKTEIDACQDWITEEIKIVQPKVIITLGEAVNKRYFTFKNMEDAVGREISFHDGAGQDCDMRILPCYHPSYLMQYGAKKIELCQDVFKKAKEIAYA
jgi:uracil-DNA glycosylase family 4